MQEHEASRTLLKSAPELWAECSDASSLARHLGAFGEIRITRTEPETTVAWEGENLCGTVRLEPSGWGTRVILTAARPADDEAAEPELEGEPDGGAEPEEAPDEDAPAPVPRIGLLARILRVIRPAREPIVLTAPADEARDLPDAPVAESAGGEDDPAELLVAALDSMGQAHHRPFSRA